MPTEPEGVPVGHNLRTTIGFVPATLVGGNRTGELATLKVWKALLRERGETFL